MYCVKCGTELPDDAAFCLRCGAPQVGGDRVGRVETPVETDKELFRVTGINKSTCIVKGNRFILQDKDGGIQQYLFRDITRIACGLSDGIFFAKPCVCIQVGVDNTFAKDSAVFKKIDEAEAFLVRVRQAMSASHLFFGQIPRADFRMPAGSGGNKATDRQWYIK